MRSIQNIATRLFLSATLLSGCAAGVSDTQFAPYRSMGFGIASSIGPVLMTVTNEADPSLPKDESKEVLRDLWLAGIGPLALVSPPFASAFILGSGLTLTMVPVVYGLEKSQFNTIMRAVIESNFPKMLADALHSRTLSPEVAGHEPTAQAFVVVRAYGLVEECFVAVAELSVERDNQRILERSLRMTGEPGEEAPLQCATLSKFAADDGRLIRETARDYAEIFAVMITNHLSELR